MSGEKRIIVDSYGGGRQSVSLIVLAAEGALQRPDIIVMADTGREKSATLDYMHDHVNPYLAKHGMGEVKIAPHTLATVDLYAHNGDMLMPVFTEDGKLPTYCSGEWKRDVVARQLRLWGVTECEQWIGFSYDEARRVSPSRRNWIKNKYPLIEMGISVEGCRIIVEKAGLPPAPKSCCWCCPHLKPEQWAEMRAEHPDDFARAVELDEKLRAVDPDRTFGERDDALEELAKLIGE